MARVSRKYEYAMSPPADVLRALMIKRLKCYSAFWKHTLKQAKSLDKMTTQQLKKLVDWFEHGSETMQVLCRLQKSK